MRKKKKIILILLLLLIVGTGIGYAKIESINGNSGFISIRRNRSYYELMGYTENTGYYTSEIMSKVKRIIINDEVGNDFTAPDNIQGELINVSGDGSDAIRAYLVPNADDSSLSDMYIIANGFIKLPQDASNLFAGFTNLTEIVNPSRLITEQTTNISSIFKGTKISSLNLAAWDMSKVTNMSSAFEDVNMTELNLSNWKYNLVTDASNMFKNSTITNLYIEDLEFNGDVNLTSMFEGTTTNLIDVKLTAKAKLTGDALFKGSKVSILKLNNLSIAGAESTLSEFALNSEINKFEGDNWNIPTITTLSNFFKGSTRLSEVTMKNLKLSDSEDFSFASMFEGCVSLNTVDLSGLTGNLKANMSNMFKGDITIIGINLSNIPGVKVTNLESFIQGDRLLELLDLTSLDLSECANYLNAFKDCENLTTINVNNTYTEPTSGDEENPYVFKEEGTVIVTILPETPDTGGEEPTEP